MKFNFPPRLLRLLGAGAKSPEEANVVAKAAVLTGTGRVRAKVLSALQVEPQTAFEVALMTGERVKNVVNRISELHAVGLVEDTGQRVMNGTSRRASTIWKVAA